MNIYEIASKHDASIVTDKQGDVAILRRHYDEEGIQQVRYAPDPCDHLPAAKWEEMTDEEAASKVC